MPESKLERDVDAAVRHCEDVGETLHELLDELYDDEKPEHLRIVNMKDIVEEHGLI